MTTGEPQWKTRYYELEETLEQMLKAFQKVLVNQDHGHGGRVPIQIRRIVPVTAGQGTSLCCIADGQNLEYSFDFFLHNELTSTVPFGPVNATEVPHEISSSKGRCVIKVRSVDDRNSITSQEVHL